jgi:ATP-dependent protease HslVU (ClpYQ) peptidase subunit
MTTIAVRAGIMAADSRVTIHTEEGGARMTQCIKIFRRKDAIIGLAGESEPGLVFLDWYGSGKPAPSVLIDAEADFTALVLTAKGIFEYGKYCRPEKVRGKYWAVGSGCKAALGAMAMGATAEKAVEVACGIDPYTAPPVHVLKLKR